MQRRGGHLQGARTSTTSRRRLREDTGEIEAAEAKKLPDARRGRRTSAASSTTTRPTATAPRPSKRWRWPRRQLGFEYLGIADHSQSLTIANGLTPERVRKQWAEIDALNEKLKGFHILKGTECDILADGSLDYDDDLLAGFDYVVASVHTLFNMPEAEMTARMCKALAHPAVTMLGHATGRLLLRRDGYKIDLERCCKRAAKHGKMIEINAQPLAARPRLDPRASAPRRWASRSSSTRTPTARANWRCSASASTSPAAAGSRRRTCSTREG